MENMLPSRSILQKFQIFIAIASIHRNIEWSRRNCIIIRIKLHRDLNLLLTSQIFMRILRRVVVNYTTHDLKGRTRTKNTHSRLWYPFYFCFSGLLKRHGVKINHIVSPSGRCVETWGSFLGISEILIFVFRKETAVPAVSLDINKGFDKVWHE